PVRGLRTGILGTVLRRRGRRGLRQHLAEARRLDVDGPRIVDGDVEELGRILGWIERAIEQGADLGRLRADRFDIGPRRWRLRRLRRWRRRGRGWGGCRGGCRGRGRGGRRAGGRRRRGGRRRGG